MSVMDAAWDAANNAAQGALTGRIIGNANARADDEEERADGWHKYAQRLESKVAQLEHELAQSKLALKKSSELFDRLNGVCTAVRDEYIKFKNLALSAFDTRKRAHEYERDRGQKLSNRLIQMEKALKRAGSYHIEWHSQAKFFLAAWESQGEIPADAVSNANAASKAAADIFLNSGRTATTQDVQDMLDQAPMPVEQAIIGNFCNSIG